jgi:hypothetical protein
MSGSLDRPQEFGRYLLDERIGYGGMAEIFRATVHGPDGYSKQVALKRILAHLAVDPERRFQSADDMAQALETFIFRGETHAGARELSTFLQRLFREDSQTTMIGERPGRLLQGRVTRIARKPRKAVHGGYLFRGLEIVEESTNRKVVVVLPEFTGDDIYSFPLFCRKGCLVAAHDLQLNNALADGSVVFAATPESVLVLDPTHVGPRRRSSSASEAKVPRSSREIVESLVAAAGGVVDRGGRQGRLPESRPERPAKGPTSPTPSSRPLGLASLETEINLTEDLEQMGSVLDRSDGEGEEITRLRSGPSSTLRSAPRHQFPGPGPLAPSATRPPRRPPQRR